MTERPYRPSNGTEGEMFMSAWCERCVKDVRHKCPILACTMAFDLSDPEYPKEWIERGGIPTCTAFQPLSVLSDRARRAWVSRRKAASDAHVGDLFGGGQ